MVAIKCTKCGKVKPAAKFSPNKHHLNGRASRCQTCCAAYAKIHQAAYRANHRAKVAAYQRAYYVSHRAELLAYQAAYRAPGIAAGALCATRADYYGRNDL